MMAAAPGKSGLSGIRVAIVSDAAPERNGVGAYYQDLLDYLVPDLASVEMFSPTIENDQWTAGLVLPLPGDATQKLCFPNPVALRRELKRLRPHVMVVATPGVYGMVGAFLAARWGVPLLTGFHTSFEQLTDLYWHGSVKGRFYQLYLEHSHRYLFNRSRLVLVNSDDMHELAKRMGADQVRLIGTPLPGAFARHPLVPFGGEFRKILFAGRLAAEKNVEAFVDAAAAISDIEVSIAGDGPLREMVEAAARRLPNLHYLGWLDRSALRDQIDLHDGLVLPSHFESFGTVALESMSRARVVIVSRGTGICRWSNLTDGMVVMAEGQSLTEAIRGVQGLGAERRKSLARRGHQAANAFNNHNIENWQQLLMDAASAGP